ncbi:glycerol-3-phosphate dehydrogenase/oxidase [Streptomyces kaniharaensis]|uniref:Glycerol-3-phosphate dehydrogenase n=1 Tax=Streptomyces kaniharaensis TaxID=212423 RepID=A0A6N7KXH5_9ACTN|nr:glycerol-3-phosphate dehydrogenase/oxidase [Streptomyces kaniharaensis]MQS14958.1 glycerol-3-phosphate dehydrogenase/oxidase [Streptomyces kaniharaensis]
MTTPNHGVIAGPFAGTSQLNAARRQLELDALAARPKIDLLVIGGGVTGAGVALDAATRGLRTVLVESRDLAFGTSRWSSKLVHGGLRYLASGRIGVARESALERGVLMTRTAPHLIRALPQLVPLLPGLLRPGQSALIRAGFHAGDALRMSAGTPGALLPRVRRIDAEHTRRLVPGVRTAGLRGGLVAHDGQLVDDVRLVVALARTAAQYGATVLTRVRAEDVTGDSARLTDVLTGESLTVSAGAVVNATGVWAGEVDTSIRLRPSRGTHVLVDAAALGHPTAALTVPVPGSVSRFVFALPQQLGRVAIGLTDEDAPGPIPDEPVPTDGEITFLLDTVNAALSTALTRADVRGAYAGLRPLIDTGGGNTADISREHAVLESPSGVVTVVGGKLTTYRRMAEDAVDAAVRLRGLPARACWTARLPLVGAPGHRDSRPVRADGVPGSLLARHGGAAREVLEAGDLAPVVEGIAVTRAEIAYAVTHEGALDAADVLHRRTRIGLVDEDAERAREAVEEIVAERQKV